MSNRSVMVFHAPTELHEQTKVIADKEMFSVSAFCRLAVNTMVKEYQNNHLSADELRKSNA